MNKQSMLTPGGGGAYIVARDNLGMHPSPGGCWRIINGLYPDGIGINFIRRCPNCICIPGFISLSGSNCSFFCFFCNAGKFAGVSVNRDCIFYPDIFFYIYDVYYSIGRVYSGIFRVT